MGKEYVVQVGSLCKDYVITRSLGQLLRRPWARARRLRALDDLSFQVSYGQITSVVGLNGAGKTTLLRILCDLLSPTTGEVNVLGLPLPGAGITVRSRVGFVPSDERSFFWQLSGWANLEFFAALYRIPPRVAARRIDQLLDCFGLVDKANGYFRDYSSGMRKRLAIVRGLLHDPQLLIMDEPTNSLDPYWDRYLRDYAHRWLRAARNRAILWSTHRMEEVDDLGGEVIKLDGGRLEYHGHGDKMLFEKWGREGGCSGNGCTASSVASAECDIR